MPRTSMNEAEIEAIKEKILDTAADIISDEGFQSVSMRKIGARVGMTAANLYNYYAGKDEINIAIRLRAGRLLYEALLAAYESGRDIHDRIRRMMRAYITYGITKPNYYSIMFDMPTPKYAHYVGSPLELLARKEKESSERTVTLLFQCARELKGQGVGIADDPELFMTLIWGQLHGLVSLHLNNSLAEIVEAPGQLIEAATEKAYEILFNTP